MSSDPEKKGLELLDRGFKSIKLPKRSLSGAKAVGYKVYKAPGDFVMIDAETATEALQKSGIIKPFKVVRASAEGSGVISPGRLHSVDEDNDSKEKNTAPEDKKASDEQGDKPEKEVAEETATAKEAPEATPEA